MNTANLQRHCQHQNMRKHVEVYDTTLRDGTQGENVSLSVDDKLKVTRLLDDLGVTYIEGGWPGSNPKDAAYFRARARTRPASMREDRRLRHDLPRRAATRRTMRISWRCSTPKRPSSRSSAKRRCCTSAKCCAPRRKKICA